MYTHVDINICRSGNAGAVDGNRHVLHLQADSADSKSILVQLWSAVLNSWTIVRLELIRVGGGIGGRTGIHNIRLIIRS